MVLAISLGTAPGLSAWTPGTGSPAAAAGFVVNPLDRTDVLAFYHTVYSASQNYASHMAWTGSVSGGVAGTTSAAFKEDVRRRINFYRAMSGLPADITFDATKSAKCQDAALMFSRNNDLSHEPPVTWLSSTAGGREAAAKSVIALGTYGPDAVDAYMRDDGAGNEFVGHRRWLNYSQAITMGTGDTPPQSSSSSSNAIWVIGDFKAAPTPSFIAWPNRGFVPIQLVPARWSLSYPGANFSAATVTMTQGGASVPTTVISRTVAGAGDNTLVWTPGGLPTSVAADTPYVVNISGISGTNIPKTYSYTVTLFDPNVLNVSPSITGISAPPATGAPYTFNPIPQADAYELRVTTASNTPWNEGAEDPLSKIIPFTSSTYSLMQTAVKRSGAMAFQLALPSFDDQSFLIARDVIPSPTSALQFHQLARYTSTTTTLRAEISTNNGSTWTTVWTRFGVGTSGSVLEPAFIAQNVSLASYAGQVVRIRFIMSRNGLAFTNGKTSNHGFFIDDVTVTDATELAGEATSSLAGTATSFTLNAATAGAPLVPGSSYHLRIRPKVGTRWFSYGEMKVVTIGMPSGYESWKSTSYPAVTGGPTGDHDNDGLSNGVEYAFGLNPTAASPSSALPQPAMVGNHYSVSFPQPAGVTGVRYGVQWSRNLTGWSPVTNSGSGGIHTFTKSMFGESRMYFRYQIEVDP